MNIEFQFDPSVANAAPGFKQALAIAASNLSAMITSPGTVTIEVGYGEIMGMPMADNVAGEGGPLGGTFLTYGQLIAELAANADSDTDRSVLAHLPAFSPPNIPSYYIAPAQLKAWGMLAPNASEGLEGAVGFSNILPYVYNQSSGIAPGQYDLVGIAEHEIAHALGRIYGDGGLELSDFSAPGVFANPNSGGYFSTDGGVTNLATYQSFDDTADLANADGPNNAFNYVTPNGSINVLTPVDKTLMDAIGFSVAPGNSNFLVADSSTNIKGYQPGAVYRGPVAGLTNELILATSANVNIVSNVSRAFIHTGSGVDAIDASSSGGSVLDGGGNSNFLTGGGGNDTFFVDDRAATTDLWSTIVNFHTDDSVTVWGVTPTDFAINWVDSSGAVGFGGLTMHATAAGRPVASTTITGFVVADLSNGKLSVSFGQTGDLPGLPGSAFMSIHAN